MPGRLDFNVDFGPKRRRRDESEPMRLLVLGDFSGKPAGERGPLASRAIHRVDIDNLDTLIRRLEPRAVVPDGEVRFQQIDDFHPDHLYARIDRFERLRRARTAAPAPPDDDQVARLLGRPPERPAPPAASGLDALIRDTVAPYVVKDTSALVAAHVQAVDAAIADEMRAVLHAPAFQAIEAAWRGVRWLVAGLELDENLQLHLLDVTREELIADVAAAAGEPANSGLYHALVDRSRRGGDGDRWSALVGLLRFGASSGDISLLAALGQVASHAGGPYLGDADPLLTRLPIDQPSDWLALRRADTARWIALAAPRMLLRMPYGRKRDPIETFAFEELSDPPQPDRLLWGPASLAMALTIARTFTAGGWQRVPDDEREIGDLPAFTFERDGEPELQPAVEQLLGDREIDTFLKAGLVPLAGRRDTTSLVVVRLQSISDPPAPVW
jgi:type VI secretion system protein ImpC